MHHERRIINSLFPQKVLDRIDVETYGIRRFLAESAKELAPGSLVLDAGAGRRPYRELFAHTSYLAVDFGCGEGTWDYSGLDAIARLETLPLAANKLDAVVCTQVLEHVPEPSAIFAELYRVLKPGGRLYLTAPQAFGEHQEPYDFFRFTSFGLRYLALKAGFTELVIHPRGGFFWFLSVMLMFMYDHLFPDRRSRLTKLLLLPLQIPAAVVFLFVIPLLFFSLDKLDTRRAITLGYTLSATKP